MSVTHGNSIVCVGGSDAERHYADAFRLEWTGGKLVTTDLPALPKPLATNPGWTAFTLTSIASHRAASSRGKRMFMSLVFA